jgi:excisionase family DNA binding protein
MDTPILLNGITLQQLAEALKPLLTQKVLEPTNGIDLPKNDLLTRDEVCKLLSINKVTLWKHTKEGKIPSIGIGRRVLYNKADVHNAVKPINH